MTAEIGHFSLILALMIAAMQSILPLVGAHRHNYNLIDFASFAAIAQFAFVAVGMIALIYSFGAADMSILLVASHANASMPLPYRLAASWGNHEGSLLLWILILSTFGGALAAFGRELPQTLKARTLAVQGMISFAFLSFSILTSNPFERLESPPAGDMELNPLLQDIGLILHPPFLYLGYVGFSIVFSFAVAALIEGRVDATWARLVRPWILSAWAFLTIGIALGSYWAYYELGWGGWWFWDPVENASFMPWLVGTALLHSAVVVERRQALVVWTILLAILTFSLSLVGTFIVRSGVITSVHAFASDPTRGIGILVIILTFTGGALALFAIRAKDFDQSVTFGKISREGGLILNNILLVTAAGTVFLGTFYPLLVEVLGPDRISVGPPYYNRSFVPLMVPLIIVVSIGAFLRWKRDDLRDALYRLRWVAILCVGVAVLLAVYLGPKNLGAGAGLVLALWLVSGAVAVLAVRVQLFRVSWRRSLDLAIRTPGALLGMVLAHAGLGLMVAGITCVTAWQQESVRSVPVGESVSIGGYEVRLTGVSTAVKDNFQSEIASFVVTRDGQMVTTMTSERRFYPVSETVTTEAGISAQGLTNLYLSLGGPDAQGAWIVRYYYHPYILLIWIGPILMAVGGLLSLADRRLRIGVFRARSATVSGLAK